MAGYDPRRPRPGTGGDEPAPVDALIDLADHGREDEVGVSHTGGTPADESVTETSPLPTASNGSMRLVLAGVAALGVLIVAVVVFRKRRA